MNGLEFVERILNYSTQRLERTQPVVPVFSPGSIGASPHSPVKAVGVGIDWNAGQLQIYTQDQLTLLKPEDVKDIHDSVRKGQSWHAYQQHKKQAERIKELETEINWLKEGAGR